MSDWKRTLMAVAPTLATAIGGPLAGAAVNVIGRALLGDGEYDESQVSQAIMGATPDQLVALKQVDNDFKVKMKGFDIKDRSDARDMAVKTSILPQVILSALYTLGYFVLLFSFISGDVVIDEGVKSEFNMILGVLTAGQIQIMNFWFGSSSGSKEKTGKLKGG